MKKGREGQLSSNTEVRESQLSVATPKVKYEIVSWLAAKIVELQDRKSSMTTPYPFLTQVRILMLGY